MKKSILFIIIGICALIFAGCENNIDHPMAGHTYYSYGGGSIGSYSVYAHFAANGSFDIDYMQKKFSGYEHNHYYHFKWSIDGNKVTVEHDNSTYWKSSVRGTIAYSGSYNASDNSVTLEGQIYEFAY